ncbi:MAG TPA: hypothetical protein VLV55_11730 [Rhizomicrobium sp.]|nr:hypothetical protein [Rhizomicrobium sp.]
MHADRSIRSLTSLGGASTSRVLNLVSVAQTKAQDPEYASRPFFLSPVINTAILVKHRLRSHEEYLFREPVSVATKIIVPFDITDLKLGGRSVFVDEKGFIDTLKQLGHYPQGGLERDVEVLRLVSRVPSLDPFLLREYLRANDVFVPNCYLEISAADQIRMYDFAAKDMLSFVKLATGADVGRSDQLTDRFVSALLADDCSDKLDPLRTVLMLDGKEFREGVFSWRGFLYYKWSLLSFWPDVGAVLKGIQDLKPKGMPTPDDAEYILFARRRIAEAMKLAGSDVGRLLKVYETAYGDLIERGKPKSFRDFLLSAPNLFLELGEKMAAISHVVSFWKYRFQRKDAPRADPDELVAILQDFESGFASAVANAGMAASA